MSEIDPNKFFLGKLYNTRNQLTDEKMYYTPADLNTHCVITGMTGSGKTGLGIVLLEEIAQKQIPAIIIDPKGDLTNLLLHFPNITGKDIAPWLDQEAPIREGKEMYEYANEKAAGRVKPTVRDAAMEAASAMETAFFIFMGYPPLKNIK